MQSTLLNDEVRTDALHAFISGLKKSLKAIVFPAQPKDLASALALAREADDSIERSMFSASYAKAKAEREHGKEDHRNRAYAKQGKHNNGAAKKPSFRQETAMVTMKRIEELNRDRPQSQWKLTFLPSLGSAEKLNNAVQCDPNAEKLR